MHFQYPGGTGKKGFSKPSLRVCAFSTRAGRARRALIKTSETLVESASKPAKAWSARASTDRKMQIQLPVL